MTTHFSRLLRQRRGEHQPPASSAHLVGSDDRIGEAALPILLNVDEVAELLRTTPRAIYAMVERSQIPGVVRIRRRLLFRTSTLLDWFDQKRAPSQESER